MEYHDGQVITGPVDVYFIFYGCWTSVCGNNGGPNTASELQLVMSNMGATPYFAINTTYPNAAGYAPSGAAYYGLSVYDPNYSRGLELTADDIKAIVTDQIESHHLPQDPNGVYVVISSSDVGSSATGLCSEVGVPPHHGNAVAFFSDTRYAFLGNPNRCPAMAGPQFIAPDGSQRPTPNNDFAADVLASDLAHAISTTITDPWGTAWYDRYGLESSDKCQGIFGTTFTTANGARANVHWGQRDYLVQQNWVNDKKGRCAMQLSQ